MKTIEQIRNGISNNEFYLVYMPTIDLATDTCVGAEALIRWDRDGELLSPDEFIPLIENTTLSGLITYWIFDEIAKDLGNWLHQHEGIHIGINVPPEVFGRGGLEYAALKSGLNKFSDKIILEITERGFPDEQGLEAISSASLGVKIAIDDFGAGDANLLELSKMDADIIKLDKFFIDQITSETHIPKILKGLVAFAKAMDFKIIAEGVETSVQAKVMKLLEVDMVQGWYYSKPLDAEEFIAFHHDL